MSINPTDVVTHWAHAWRSLAAWRVPLAVGLTIEPYKGRGRLGFAQDRTATVYVTGNLAEDLSTALHELAHLAAPRCNNHGQAWRDLYVAAVAEATLTDACFFETDVTITALDAQVVIVIHDWLKRSGQLAVLKAIGAGGL